VAKKEIFFLTTAFRLVLRPAQALTQWILEYLYLGAILAGGQA